MAHTLGGRKIMTAPTRACEANLSARIAELDKAYFPIVFCIERLLPGPHEVSIPLTQAFSKNCVPRSSSNMFTWIKNASTKELDT